MSRTILLVEDDPAILKALTIRLTANRYRVVTATDADSAISVATKVKPDLIILDISLPGGNGFTIVEQLRTDTKIVNTPVVFITASKRSELWAKAMEIGAHGYLEKPFDSRELIDIVDNLISFRK